MSKSKEKIKIVFPNGEKVECDNLIALLQIDDLVEEFEQLLIGNWNLNELVETKFFLDQMYNERIKEKLPVQDKLIFENLQEKKKEYENKLKDSLTEEEKELYDFLEPEPEILMSGDLPEDINEEDIEDFFDEIFNTLDQLEENKFEQSKNSSTKNKKVVDIDKYRNR